MVEVIDVAAYVLEQVGSVTTMKLQKLVYYSQVRHLIACGSPLFPEEIQAWANGPVSPKLYHAHSGKYMISRGGVSSNDSSDRLSPLEREVIDFVVEKLGSYSGEQLRELSHSERPWQEARRGYAPGDRCSEPITIDSIRKFYSSSSCSNPVVCSL